METLATLIGYLVIGVTILFVVLTAIIFIFPTGEDWEVKDGSKICKTDGQWMSFEQKETCLNLKIDEQN